MFFKRILQNIKCSGENSERRPTNNCYAEPWMVQKSCIGVGSEGVHNII